ncbi:MAG: site-2 protease family protein [Clostridia bacterium]|nr:site-2 protease family protein [Clostridia bacterium]
MGILNLLTSSYDIKTKIMLFLFTALIVVFSLSVHECSHGLAAYALGDSTAKYRGRLTLNPKKHMNPVGTIMMLLIGFGYAEPVPINPNNFKNRKLGMAISAFAGPFSNFILAFIAIFSEKLVLNAVNSSEDALMSYFSGNSFFYYLDLFLYLMAIMNLALMVFNLIPIPPLDGSRILNIFLPEKYYFKLMRYEQYTALIFFAVVFLSTRLFKFDILFGIPNAIYNGLYKLVSLII